MPGLLPEGANKTVNKAVSLLLSGRRRPPCTATVICLLYLNQQGASNLKVTPPVDSAIA